MSRKQLQFSSILPLCNFQDNLWWDLSHTRHFTYYEHHITITNEFLNFIFSDNFCHFLINQTIHFPEWLWGHTKGDASIVCDIFISCNLQNGTDEQHKKMFL